MIRKIDSNIFSLTILKVTTFSRIRQILRFITSWYSYCCTYPSFQSARFYTFPRFCNLIFYTFPRSLLVQNYTFPRIRRCFSLRILSFLMFFTLISMMRDQDSIICWQTISVYALISFFLFLSLTFPLFKF